MSSNSRCTTSSHLEICVSGIGYHIEPHTLLEYFEQFGKIEYYNFTAPDGGGLVFITYMNHESVDRCMASRPHRLDRQHVYVKRVVPSNSESPRDRIDSCRDLLIVVDWNPVDEQFLKELREHFSSYGTLYACKYCHEENFDYVLIEFADYDQVDRIILDKPHCVNKHPLNLMKCTTFNKTLLNTKFSSKLNQIDSDSATIELSSTTSSYRNGDDSVSEMNLESEVHRLQDLLRQINVDFHHERKQLEDKCCEQLQKLNEDADKAHQLQQDLEQECAKLLAEYESLKQENETLNEQFLTVELENFEITSYYEQILAEEKLKTAQYETQYTEKLELMYADDPAPPAIPDDTDD